MKRRVSWRSAIAAGLWRAALVTTAWGQEDDVYNVSTFNNELRTLDGTGGQPEQILYILVPLCDYISLRGQEHLLIFLYACSCFMCLSVKSAFPCVRTWILLQKFS